MANVFKNLGQLASNKFTSLIQNPDSLKAESLILASLALVISRICIATTSAIKAQGTPEGPYRYKESIRTDIREVCGWTFGFVVLRFIQNKIVKPALGKLLGVTESADPNAYSLWKGMKELFKGKVEKFTPHLEQGVVTEWNGSRVSKWLAEAKPVQWLINKLYGNLEHDAKADFMVKLYKMGGIFLASIPTVALAGYALERFTRDHSDQVVDAVSGFLSNSAHKVQAGAGLVQGKVQGKMHGQIRQHTPFAPFQGRGVQGGAPSAAFAFNHPFVQQPMVQRPVGMPVSLGVPSPVLQAPVLPSPVSRFAGHRPTGPMVYPMPRVANTGGRFAI
jgi:hypothetical protein